MGDGLQNRTGCHLTYSTTHAIMSHNQKAFYLNRLGEPLHGRFPFGGFRLSGGQMMDKTAILNVRTTPELVHRVQEVARQYGFVKPSGRLNHSKAVRYILSIGLATIKKQEIAADEQHA